MYIFCEVFFWTKLSTECITQSFYYNRKSVIFPQEKTILIDFTDIISLRYLKNVIKIKLIFTACTISTYYKRDVTRSNYVINLLVTNESKFMTACKTSDSYVQRWDVGLWLTTARPPDDS